MEYLNQEVWFFVLNFLLEYMLLDAFDSEK